MAVTIKLYPGCENEKSYQVPHIYGKVLRELDMVKPAFDKANRNEIPVREELESCWEWFTHLFGNQFTVDELLDGYPAGDLMPDIFAAYLAITNNAVKVLTDFPLPPAPTSQEKK